MYLTIFEQHFNRLSRWGQSKLYVTESRCGCGRCFFVEIIGHSLYERQFQENACSVRCPQRKRFGRGNGISAEIADSTAHTDFQNL